MSIKVRRFTQQDSLCWDDFVERSLNGTMMHSRRFLQYHPADRFVDQSLLFFEGAKVAAVFSATETLQDGCRTLQSHSGATYGGLVVDERVTSDSADELVRKLVDYGARNGFDCIRMRVSEKVFHRRWCEELDAAYLRWGFSIEGRELSSAFRLEGSSEEELLGRFREAGRRNVRKALKHNVVARPSEEFERFWPILEHNLRSRHGVSPTHSLDDILRLRDLLGERVVLMGGYLGKQLLSGVVLFLMNDVAAHTMYMAQNHEFQRLRSLNLVVYHTLLECSRRGMRYLNYGISSIPGTRGVQMNSGLYAFKRNCGGEGVVRELLVKWLGPQP